MASCLFFTYNNASTANREVCMCENRKDTPNANGGSLSLSGVFPLARQNLYESFVPRCRYFHQSLCEVLPSTLG